MVSRSILEASTRLRSFTSSLRDPIGEVISYSSGLGLMNAARAEERSVASFGSCCAATASARDFWLFCCRISPAIQRLMTVLGLKGTSRYLQNIQKQQADAGKVVEI